MVVVFVVGFMVLSGDVVGGVVGGVGVCRTSWGVVREKGPVETTDIT